MVSLGAHEWTMATELGQRMNLIFVYFSNHETMKRLPSASFLLLLLSKQLPHFWVFSMVANQNTSAPLPDLICFIQRTSTYPTGTIPSIICTISLFEQIYSHDATEPAFSVSLGFFVCRP
jgi:hypothetical protein